MACSMETHASHSPCMRQADCFRKWFRKRDGSGEARVRTHGVFGTAVSDWQLIVCPRDLLERRWLRLAECYMLRGTRDEGGSTMTFVGLQEALRKELRKRIGAGELTGMELARRTGFTQAHISNFLNRKRGLKLTALDRTLAAAGISLYDLLNLQELARSAARQSSEKRKDAGSQV
jgi:hypothetical protein